MKILFIGNSFSSDLTRYMQDISGGELFVRNLYIGGCPLEWHAENLKSGASAYEYCENAEKIRMISIPEAVETEDWDYISLQQVSGLSGIPESYEPYIFELIAYLKENKPKAKLVFHKTWAYESTSEHPSFVNYNCDGALMYERITSTVKEISEKYSLPVIPSGDAVNAARMMPEFSTDGDTVITRDGFHMNIPYGRYLIGLVANKFFTGKPAAEVSYVPDNADAELCGKLRALADTIL